MNESDFENQKSKNDHLLKENSELAQELQDVNLLNHNYGLELSRLDQFLTKLEKKKQRYYKDIAINDKKIVSIQNKIEKIRSKLIENKDVEGFMKDSEEISQKMELFFDDITTIRGQIEEISDELLFKTIEEKENRCEMLLNLIDIYCSEIMLIKSLKISEEKEENNDIFVNNKEELEAIKRYINDKEEVHTETAACMSSSPNIPPKNLEKEISNSELDLEQNNVINVFVIGDPVIYEEHSIEVEEENIIHKNSDGHRLLRYKLSDMASEYEYEYSDGDEYDKDEGENGVFRRVILKESPQNNDFSSSFHEFPIAKALFSSSTFFSINGGSILQIDCSPTIHIPEIQTEMEFFSQETDLNNVQDILPQLRKEVNNVEDRLQLEIEYKKARIKEKEIELNELETKLKKRNPNIVESNSLRYENCFEISIKGEFIETNMYATKVSSTDISQQHIELLEEKDISIRQDINKIETIKTNMSNEENQLSELERNSSIYSSELTEKENIIISLGESVVEQEKILVSDLPLKTEESKLIHNKKELEMVSSQIQIRQAQYEKIAEESKSYESQLIELGQYRKKLEKQLEDLSNRMKPEIRTLLNDFNDSKTQVLLIDQQLKEKRESLAQSISFYEQMKNSQENMALIEKKLVKMNLERRNQKWDIITRDSRESWQSIESFSTKNETQRKSLVNQIKSLDRKILQKQESIDELEKYIQYLEESVHVYKYSP